jgi:hypothetical protein
MKDNRNINTLKEYIKNIKKNASNCKCNAKNIQKKRSSKAQAVDFCGDTVIKSSLSDKAEEIIKRKNNSTIKIDSVTINLLIQTMIKVYIKNMKLNNRVIEHYNNLCKGEGKVKLVSKKANYPEFPTLEDYILYSKDEKEVKKKFIIKCLTSMFVILDKLYDDIQFHHCDPKCAQLFLFSDKDSKDPICMLADLDKVTFTLNINNNPYRIRITKDTRKNTFRGVALTVASKINFLNKITDMRFQSKPINSNLLEKITFISSACILLNSPNKSEELRDIMLDKVLKKYMKDVKQKLDYNQIIRLDDYYSSGRSSNNLKKAKSFMTAIEYVDYDYLFKHFKEYLVPAKNLHSILCLEKIEENVNLKRKIDENINKKLESKKNNTNKYKLSLCKK